MIDTKSIKYRSGRGDESRLLWLKLKKQRVPRCHRKVKQGFEPRFRDRFGALLEQGKLSLPWSLSRMPQSSGSYSAVLGWHRLELLSRCSKELSLRHLVVLSFWIHELSKNFLVYVFRDKGNCAIKIAGSSPSGVIRRQYTSTISRLVSIQIHA